MIRFFIFFTQSRFAGRVPVGMFLRNIRVRQKPMAGGKVGRRWLGGGLIGLLEEVGKDRQEGPKLLLNR